MKYCIALLLSMLLAIPAWTQQAFRARVVDGKTGEPLPLASIYVSEEKYALTNDEGDFTIMAMPSDTVRISYVGYNAQIMRLSSLPAQVKMKPMENVLREVHPVPVERIMLKLIKKLNKENNNDRSLSRTYYFFRMTATGSELGDLVTEGFFVAFGTININIIAFLNGRTYYKNGYAEEVKDTLPAISQSNLHKLLELGPELPTRNSISIPLNTPLPEWAKTIDDLRGSKFRCRELKSDTGEDIYKISVFVDPNVSARLGNSRKGRAEKDTLSDQLALPGTIYLSKKKHRLLSFDGQLMGYSIKETYERVERTIPAEVYLHMNFTHERHFTEPMTVRCEVKYGDKHLRIVAIKVKSTFNLRRLPYSSIPKKLEEGWNNMIQGIESNPYKPILWKEDILKRMEEEERIIQDATKEDEEMEYNTQPQNSQ